MYGVRTRLLVLLTILLLSFALANCGTPSPSPAVEPGDSANTTVQVVDAAGRTVKLDHVPQRIMVVGRGPYMALHLLYMFPEARERLIGMETKGSAASDFLPLVDPAFQGKPTLEANPGPEQIAALQPDLVLVKGSTVDQMSESLGQVDIPVVYLGLETPDQFFKDVNNLGILLGNEARAQEIILFFQGRLDRIRQGTAALKEGDKPRVLLLMYTDRGGTVAVQVPAASWIQTIEVQKAGGNPVYLEAAEIGDGWTVVNLEQIALWDPDKIFAVIWYTLDPRTVIDSLKADPQWSALEAVKNGELYAFPSDIYGWDSPDPRWILGMTWLATKIHPGRFTDVDMREEVYEYFGQMYGMDKATIDAGILPKVYLDIH